MRPGVLRSIAVAIAVFAAVDPGFVRTTTERPVVALLSSPGSVTPERVEEVRNALSDDFIIVSAPFPRSATVVVGDRIPAAYGDVSGPVFAIMNRPANRVAIEHVTVPPRVQVEERVPIDVRVSGVAGDSVTLRLVHDDLVLDQAAGAAGRNRTMSARLWFTPTAASMVPLRVEARGRAGVDTADVALTIGARPHSVLFFDKRPSWMSTFVRRAVERDPRFVVTSRTVTSRGVSTDVGAPPADLGDIAESGLFDAVVVGAPEVLGDRDVGALEAYMRRRGGAVVLLYSNPQRGSRIAMAGSHWSRIRSDSAQPVLSPALEDTLRASELAWPDPLPVGAQQLATVIRSGSDRPVLWRTSFGTGRLIVSGALDSWVYRDSATSDFESFWKRTIAAAAALTPDALQISVDHATLRPGEIGRATVSIHAAATADRSPGSVHARASAGMHGTGTSESISLWPRGEPGVLRGEFRAPDEPGMYRITAAAGAATAKTHIIVRSGAQRALTLEDDLLAAWTKAHGGRVVNSADEVIPMLQRALDVPARAELWYPMRSPWWILPFAAALGAEWFWRRRRGLM